jgi:hypothetical protein
MRISEVMRDRLSLVSQYMVRKLGTLWKRGTEIDYISVKPPELALDELLMVIFTDESGDTHVFDISGWRGYVDFLCYLDPNRRLHTEVYRVPMTIKTSLLVHGD